MGKCAMRVLPVTGWLSARERLLSVSRDLSEDPVEVLIPVTPVEGPSVNKLQKNEWHSSTNVHLPPGLYLMNTESLPWTVASPRDDYLTLQRVDVSLQESMVQPTLDPERKCRFHAGTLTLNNSFTFRITAKASAT